ncbi:hypothetical protein V6Z11_D05G321400 [Gossypium hirsutum]
MGNIHHLPHSISDHCPLLLTTKTENDNFGKPSFKFKAWWTMEESLEGEIKASWESSTNNVLEKLEKLQSDLKKWAGEIKKGREGLKKRLTKKLEMLMEKESTDDIMAEIIDTKVHLNLEIDKDERYWEQRARVNWIKSGDKNTTFFYRHATSRQKKNTISRLELVGGGEVTEECMISEEATLFFQKLFTSKGVGELSYLLTGIEEKITLEINEDLMGKFKEEEVHLALKGMGPTKAPGPDGFPALFFQQYWHIVGKEVTIFCLEILNSDKNLGHTNFIVLF